MKKILIKSKEEIIKCGVEGKSTTGIHISFNGYFEMCGKQYRILDDARLGVIAKLDRDDPFGIVMLDPKWYTEIPTTEIPTTENKMTKEELKKLLKENLTLEVKFYDPYGCGNDQEISIFFDGELIAKEMIHV